LTKEELNKCLDIAIKALEKIADSTISIGKFKDMAETEYNLILDKETIAAEALGTIKNLDNTIEE